MKTKLLAIIAVLSVISSIFVSSAAVYAFGGTGAIASAQYGISNSAVSVPPGSYAYAMADAAGSVTSHVGTSGTYHASTSAEAIADADSYAFVQVLGTAYNSPGSTINASGEAVATGGSTSYIYVDTEVSPRSSGVGEGVIDVTVDSLAGGGAHAMVDLVEDGGEVYIDSSSSGRITVDANAEAVGASASAIIASSGIEITHWSSGTVEVNADATSSGPRANAYISLGEVGVDNGSQGSVELSLDSGASGTDSDAIIAHVQALIDNGSSGDASINATASSYGDNADSYIGGIYTVIDNGSSGTADLSLSATADGHDTYAGINNAGIFMYWGGAGNANLTAAATATGDNSKAIIQSAYVGIVYDDGSGDIDSTVTATADGGASALAGSYTLVLDGSGDFTVYAIADASGEGGYAQSYVAVQDGIPAGAYIDVAGDANGFAIAFVLSYGDGDVIAVSWTNTNGGQAGAYIDAGAWGVEIDAIVGMFPG